MALRMTVKARAAGGIMLLALLAGCGTGEREGFGTAATLATSAVQGVIAGRRSGGGIGLTDAQLLAYPEPLLRVRIPSRGAEALLVRQVVNEGRAFTWVTQDGITVTLRQGQVIGTRGLGNDLMSVDAQDVRGLRGQHVRDQFQLGGDERVARSRYLCTVAEAGPRQIVVAGRAHRTTLLVERCQSDGLAIENSYWVEPDGLVRKARQFTTPELGYLEFENIHG